MNMNVKRAKYSITADVKEEVVPVIIEDGKLDQSSDESPQYVFATFTTGDETISSNNTEVIIDEHGRAMTIQQLVSEEGNTVEEVETVENSDGTHTILHIVPGTSILETEEIVTDGDISNDPNDPSGSKSKTFYCPNCGNCYSAAGSLKLHMRACMRQRQEIPPEDRKCPTCKKVFNSVAYLKEHMMRHTGEGPTRCPRCYRKFVDDDKYKAHLETHQQQDKLDREAEALAKAHGGRKVVVKEFTCSFCSENFTVVFDAGQVKRRYACDTCREKYSNAEMLKRHKTMIEEKREFHCERCGRRFVFEGFLQRHLPTCDGTIKRRRDMKQ